MHKKFPLDVEFFFSPESGACGKMNLKRCFSSLANFSIFVNQEGDLYGCGIPSATPNPTGECTSELTKIQLPPHPSGGSFSILTVACGTSHTLALTSDWSVITWGQNYCGQLGFAHPSESGPTILAFPKTVKEIACGHNTSALLDKKGSLFMWGSNTDGQLGIGHKNNTCDPSRVDLPAPVISVACGYAHSVALTQDGKIYAWGRNDNGELGLGKEFPASCLPILVPGISEIRHICKLRYDCHR